MAGFWIYKRQIYVLWKLDDKDSTTVPMSQERDRSYYFGSSYKSVYNKVGIYCKGFKLIYRLKPLLLEISILLV